MRRQASRGDDSPMTTAPLTTAGMLVEAVSRQDFAVLRECLADSVRFRALLPPGVVETTGADEATARFRGWVGGPDSIEVIDAEIGSIAAKASVRWRLRLTTAAGVSRIVEQHMFVTGEGRLETVELLCSGFVEVPR
jgi:hypothetical protein